VAVLRVCGWRQISPATAIPSASGSPWKTDLLITIEPSGILLEPDGFFLWIPKKKRKVFVQNAEKTIDIPGGVVIIDIYLISWETVGSSAV
jgi:hypothetical protein